MKNKTYYLGLLASLITTLGCLFKILHLPGASILLTLGLVILALLFIPLGLRSSFTTEPNKKLKTLYILAAFIFALNFIGVLFKIMHWPGAEILMIINIPLPFVVLLPVYLFSYPTDKDINYKNFMAVMFFFAYFAAITALLALSVSRNVIDGFVKSSISFEEKATVVEENTKWYISEYKNDSTINKKLILVNTKIREEADTLCEKIESLKKMILISYAGNTNEVIKDNKVGNLMEIKFKDSKPSLDMYYITELKNEINDFKILLQNESNNSSTNHHLDEVFNTNEKNSNGEPWEKLLLKDKILVSAIEQLNLLEYRVRLAAFEVISSSY